MSNSVVSPNELAPPSEALGGKLPVAGESHHEQAEEEQSAERLALRVASLVLLCPIGQGREVLPVPETTRLPYLPPWLPGIANVRGMLVPVVDPVVALGLERSGNEAPHTHLLVFGTTQSDLIGLMVDGLPVPCSMQAGERMKGIPPHPEMLQGHVHGAYVRDGETWLDVDLEGLFERMRSGVEAGERADHRA